MQNIHAKIHKSGLFEFVYLSFLIICNRLLSLLSIVFLRMRGYAIDYSVLLGRHVVFFQSNKYAIEIGENSFIGDGVRLKAGFDGKIKIGKNVKVHDYSFIFAQETLTIGDNTLISPHVFITDFNHKIPHSTHWHLLASKTGYINSRVSIGNHVWIGANVVILPGVTIADDTVIGAGSVVTKNISKGSIAVGNPARVISSVHRKKDK